MTPDQLVRVHAAAFDWPRPWTENEFISLLNNKHVHLVACAKGFALSRVIADEMELLTIAVLPNSRRTGLGGKLLGEVHATARGLGAQKALLEVAESNNAARLLYQRNGYRQCGARPAYFRRADGQSEDALLFACELTANAADLG